MDDNWLNVSEDNSDVLVLGIFAKLMRKGKTKNKLNIEINRTIIRY